MREEARMRIPAMDVPPVRYELLPENWPSLELDYRSNPPASRPLAETVMSLLIHAAIGLVVMILVRFLGWTVLSATGFIVSFAIAAPFAIKDYLRHKNGRRAALQLLVGPVALLMIALCHYATNYVVLRFIVLGGAIALLIAVVDEIANHFAYWMFANPRLTREERKAYMRPWRNRRKHAPDTTVSKAALLLRDYGAYTLFPLIYVGVALIPLEGIGVLFALIAPPLIAYIVAMSRSSHANGVTPLGATIRALKSWFSYGRYTLDAPGLFLSPAGDVERRGYLHLATITFLAATLLPALSYVPLVYMLSPSDSWDKSFQSVKAFVPEERRRAFAEELGHPLPKGDNTRYRRSSDRGEIQSAWREIPTSAYVQAKPENWIYLALRAPSELHFWAVISSLLLCIVLPFLTVFSTLLFTAGPYLAALHAEIEAGEPEGDLERSAQTPWAWRVARLQESSNELERDHLWLGAHAEADCPILLHKDILNEHAYLVGDSGSGKTALGITPLVTQLVRNTDAAVVVLDLKGDQALFQSVRHEASEANREFRWFSNELGRSTCVFNPFTQYQDGRISVNQICETLLEALNLNHGEGYGRSYYSRVARRWLSATLRREQGNIRSFRQLYELSKKAEHLNAKEKQDAFELIAVVESLATLEQLNLRPDTDNQELLDFSIHFPTVIEEGQVVYFWLPAAVESATVREISKLALYSLLSAAFSHSRDSGGDGRQTYLVIDEFQRMASDNFKIILEQARSMGVGIILANQTMEDLKTNDTDLRATVQTNTRFKQSFSATDLDQQDRMMKASGEALYFTSPRDVGEFWVRPRNVLPRLQRNDIILASDHPLHSIIQVVRGSGYTQHGGFSMPIEGSFHIPRSKYEARQAAPWPERSAKTIVPTEPWMEPSDYATVDDRLEDTSRVFDDESDDIIIE